MLTRVGDGVPGGHLCTLRATVKSKCHAGSISRLLACHTLTVVWVGGVIHVSVAEDEGVRQCYIQWIQLHKKIWIVLFWERNDTLLLIIESVVDGESECWSFRILSRRYLCDSVARKWKQVNLQKVLFVRELLIQSYTDMQWLLRSISEPHWQSCSWCTLSQSHLEDHLSGTRARLWRFFAFVLRWAVVQMVCFWFVCQGLTGRRKDTWGEERRWGSAQRNGKKSTAVKQSPGRLSSSAFI